MKRSLAALAVLLVPATASADPPASGPSAAPAAPAATPAAPAAAPAPYPYGYAPPPYAYGYPPPAYGYYPYSYPPAPPVQRFTVRTEPYKGGPIPEGAKLKTERSNGLLAAGTATFGALYLASVIYALAACPPGREAGDCPANSGWLYVPIVGPFITAAESNASFGGRNLAIFDGVFQLLGAGTAIYALASSKEVLEFREPVSATSTQTRKTASLRLAPVAAGAQVGATLSALAF